MLIALIVIGVLAAIIVPSWMRFVEVQKVNKAQGRAYWSLTEAKNTAKQEKRKAEVCFKIIDDKLHYSTHRWLKKRVAGRTVACAGANWNAFKPVPDVIVDPRNTTFYYNRRQEVWRMQFNMYGVSNGRLGKITFTTSDGKHKRCVIVSTLLGAMRSSSGKGCGKK